MTWHVLVLIMYVFLIIVYLLERITLYTNHKVMLQLANDQFSIQFIPQ